MIYSAEDLMSNQPYTTEMSYYEYEYNVSHYLDYGGFCVFPNYQNVVVVVGSIFCILGLVGNSMVIVTYAFYKRIKCMTDIYLINVAIGNLLFVLALPFIVYNVLWSWPMGRAACKLLGGSYSVNLYSGALLFACISTDRYIGIAQARRRRWLSYSSIICTIVWIFAILVSVPTFYLYEWYELSYMNRQTDIQSSTPEYVCVLNSEGPAMAVSITQISVGFFLPLFIMIFFFSGIIITLLKTRDLQHHREVREMQVVVAVFIICHLPYNAVLLYNTVTMVTVFEAFSCGEPDTLEMVLIVSRTIAYLHCCLNPMLYAVVGVNFRNHFRRIFRDLWCLRKAPGRFSRVTSNFYTPSALRSMDGSSKSGASFTM